MKFSDFTAYAGELCLYLAAVGFLLSPPGDMAGMAIFLAVCLLAESACTLWGKRKGIVPYLPLLLLVPFFFTAQTIRELLRPAPVLILLLLRCRARRWRMEYYSVRSLFQTGGVIYLVLFMAFLITQHIDRLVSDSFPFFVMWLLLSVYNMRMLRNPYVASLDGRFKALNAVLLLCVALTGALLSSGPAVTAVTTVLKALWSGVIAPLLFVVIYVVAILFSLLWYAANYLFWLFAKDPGEVEPPKIETGQMQDALMETMPEMAEPSQWLIRLAILAGVAAFLIVAWLIARNMISPAVKDTEDPGALQRESLASPGRKPRRGMGRAPAEGVREVYRKYLALCASFQIPVDGRAASDVIRDLSAPYTGGEDAGALREQWLRARFSGQETSPEEVREARQLLRRMRETAAKAKRAENKQRKMGR